MNDVFASFDFLTFLAWAVPILVLYQVSHQIGRVVGVLERMAEQQEDRFLDISRELQDISINLEQSADVLADKLADEKDP